MLSITKLHALPNLRGDFNGLWHRYSMPTCPDVETMFTQCLIFVYACRALRRSVKRHGILPSGPVALGKALQVLPTLNPMTPRDKR